MSIVTFTLVKHRWVTLGRVRHQSFKHVEQFFYADASCGGYKTDRHEVALAQGLLEWRVQLLGRKFFTLLQVKLHQLIVDFHDLVNDLGMGCLDVAESGVSTIWLEKAVNDSTTVGCRQVDGQALRAECRTNIIDEPGQIYAFLIDFVDNDHPTKTLLFRGVHHPARDHLNAVLGIDYDCCRLNGRQY